MDSDHQYQHGPKERRSPCPALNTLANHGYVNRDGQHVKLRELVDALVKVYNLDWKLAAVLASTGIILCGDIRKREVDLQKLALHNAIEHDFSLVHADANGHKYAPTDVDKERLEQLLTINNDGKERSYLTERDLVQHRLNLMDKSGKLSKIHEVLASGEILMIMDVFGEEAPVAKDKDGKEKKRIIVRKDIIRAWMSEERLPTDLRWNRPSKPLTFSQLNEQQAEYKKLVDDILGKDETNPLENIFEALVQKVQAAVH